MRDFNCPLTIKKQLEVIINLMISQAQETVVK